MLLLSTFKCHFPQVEVRPKKLKTLNACIRTQAEPCSNEITLSCIYDNRNDIGKAEHTRVVIVSQSAEAIAAWIVVGVAIVVAGAGAGAAAVISVHVVFLPLRFSPPYFVFCQHFFVS